MALPGIFNVFWSYTKMTHYAITTLIVCYKNGNAGFIAPKLIMVYYYINHSISHSIYTKGGVNEPPNSASS